MPIPPTVLILDSGVGGLSIYHTLWQRLPYCHFIYAFDNAAFPYGEKHDSEITQRVILLIEAVRQRHLLQLVVVACNTASTFLLPLLRKRFPWPIVGVVPAIKHAATLTRNQIIGLLATRATVQRTYIDTLIQQFAPHCSIERIGSGRLVELAENKLIGLPCSQEEIAAILSPWLVRTANERPDTIVLGCTHFSLLQEELRLLFPSPTALVDATEGVARQVIHLLATQMGTADHQLQHAYTLSASPVQNHAYCTRLDPHSEALRPLLSQYHLSPLEILSPIRTLDKFFKQHYP